MWCPSCRTEYREGISRCADCRTELVGALPPPPTPPREAPITGPFSPDDDVVELMTTTAAEAEVTAAHLRSAGIPAVVFGVDAYSGYGAAFQNAQGARIMVRRGDVGRATSFIGDPVDQPPAPRSMWVRGLALFVLLPIVISVLAVFPQALLVVIGAGIVAVAVATRRRKGHSPAPARKTR